MLFVSWLLFSWLIETSIALLRFPSVRELWLFGKSIKAKGKDDLTSTDTCSNAYQCQGLAAGSESEQCPLSSWQMCPCLAVRGTALPFLLAPLAHSH